MKKIEILLEKGVINKKTENNKNIDRRIERRVENFFDIATVSIK